MLFIFIKMYLALEIRVCLFFVLFKVSLKQMCRRVIVSCTTKAS